MEEKKRNTKEIIIQYIPQEIRIAFRENGRLSDIHIERPNFRNPIGNIYKGRVLKVLTGMESAFVDIGLEKAAFLFVDDARPLKEIEQFVERQGEKNNGKSKTEKPAVEFQFPKGGKNVAKKQAEKKEENFSDKEVQNLKITDLLKDGQEIIVQVFKAPISTKGSRISCNISIPGRNLVFLPHTPGLSFSKQITNEQERERMRSALNPILHKEHGIIVRTAGKSANEQTFQAELNYLVEVWAQIQKNFKSQPSPSLLFEEPNLIYRIMRDNLSPNIERIIIDDQEQYEKLADFFGKFMPEFQSKLNFYNERMSIFDYYNISDDLKMAFGRKVPLDSGGHLIIDQAEALTSIDVNTGKFIGLGSHEDTILHTNLEAIKEIVYQIKLRDIGGIIIIDFIDMEKTENRQAVYNSLKAEMRQDRTRTRISAISEMGLVEMTRQRTQENLNKLISDTCPYCDGSGLIRSSETVFFNICRELYTFKRHKKLPAHLSVEVHPDILDYVEFENREALETLKNKLETKIFFYSNRNFHPEQYQFVSKEF